MFLVFTRVSHPPDVMLSVQYEPARDQINHSLSVEYPMTKKQLSKKHPTLPKPWLYLPKPWLYNIPCPPARHAPTRPGHHNLRLPAEGHPRGRGVAAPPYHLQEGEDASPTKRQESERTTL